MDSPYTTPVTPLYDIMKYMRVEKDGTWYFTGKTLEIRIPKRFSVYNCLDIGDEVQTLAICDMIVDGQYQFPLNLLAMITIIPSDVTQWTYKGVPYIVLHLQTNDVFMKSSDVLKNDGSIFATWSDFINFGNTIYSLSYRGLGLMYSDVEETTGSGLGVGPSVYEVAVAFLSRDQKQPLMPYRLTDMKLPPRYVALRSIPLARTGTMSRMSGVYFDTALTASLRYQVTTNQPFEDIARAVSAMQRSNPDGSPLLGSR